MTRAIADLLTTLRRALFGEPEELLLARYLAGELSADMADAFHRRLENDQAFFERNVPLINFVRYGPPPRRNPAAVAIERAVQAESFWHSSRARLGLAPLPYDAAFMHSYDDRELSDMSFHQIVAWAGEHLPPWSVQSYMAGIVGVLSFAAAVIFGVPRLQAAYVAHEQAAQGRANSTWMLVARQLQTAADQTSTFAFADSSVVTLGGASRIYIHGIGQPNLALPTGQITADGDVTLTVPPGKQLVTLRTHDVEALLTPGRYRVRAVPKSGFTSIEVAAGTATVHGLAAPGNDVALLAGRSAKFTTAGLIP